MRVILVLASLLLLVGCLPPTQEQLRTEKDLAEMKRRLAQLEVRNAEAAQSETAGGDALQRQLAEVTAGLDNLRVEFQSVYGRMDDLAKNNQALADELQVVKEDMGLQLTSLENRVGELDTRLGEQAAAVKAPPEQSQQQVKAEPTAEELYEQALDLIRNQNRFVDGRKLLEKFIAKYPKHDLYVNAYYWIGESYYGEKDYELAILQFQDVISKYPHHPKAPAAMLKQALAFNALGDAQNAKTTMQKLVEDYPDSAQADSAKKFLAKGQ